MKAQLLALVVLAFVVVAFASRSHHEFANGRRAPHGWTNKGESCPHKQHSLLIALKQRNLDVLEDIATRVSDPEDPLYGQYLSIEEINALVAPESQSVDVVVNWLRRHDVTEIELTESGDFLRVRAPVQIVETLFDVKMSRFEHSSGLKLVRTLDSYSVPLEVSKHIDFVGGLIRFPSMKSYLRLSASNSADVNPAVIKSTYKIPSSTVGKSANNSQGVAQFLEQYYAPSDLSTFFKNNKLPLQYSTVGKVIGPNDPENPGDEATLDIQYIMGVAPGVQTWFVYTSGRDGSQEPFLEWVVAMNGRTDTPSVFSVSYGDDENSLSVDYCTRVNAEFMKFASSGRSLLFASGDSGVGCAHCKRFVPSFPASSPWVTAVGGTQLDSGVEVAAYFGSGGGFSDYFARPSYQSEAVAAYLNGGDLPAASFFNASGRAYPDVSALGVSFEIVMDGSTYPVDGTSCASPTFAAVVSLLNDVQMQNNQPALGFLNPWVYKLDATKSGFTDIVSGDNGDGCCNGFKARAGWDPATGVGTPNYTELLKLLPKSL